MKRYTDRDEALRTMHKTVFKVCHSLCVNYIFPNFHRARFVVHQTSRDTTKHHWIVLCKLYHMDEVTDVNLALLLRQNILLCVSFSGVIIQDLGLRRRYAEHNKRLRIFPRHLKDHIGNSIRISTRLQRIA